MELAYAVVHDDPPQVFAAEDVTTLQWVLAVRVVAATSPVRLTADGAERLREALLEERWGDALVAWIGITGTSVDVFPHGLTVATRETFSPEIAAAEMQFGALFRE